MTRREREREKKRYRLRGRPYEILKRQVWFYQGEQCFYGFECCVNTPDTIAHKDHNPMNWDPSNVTVSCDPCNKRISNQGRRGVDLLVRERESLGKRELLPYENLVPLSDSMKVALENWLWARLGPNGHHKYLPLALIYREAGHDLNISYPVLYRHLERPGDFVASNARWKHVDRALDPKLPEAKTKCLAWKGTKETPEFEEELEAKN